MLKGKPIHSKSNGTRYEFKFRIVDLLLIYTTLIFRVSEEDQMKNEVINLKSRVTRLNQEKDKLFAKIEEEERKTIESVTKFK